MDVPCRRCPKCLQFRQMQWRERALLEILASNRTWFVTLTFDEPHLAGIIAEAMLNECHEDEALTEGHIETAAYRHVQRYFKRLRKAKAVFRYLAIFERGEDTGRPHYHLFLHETGTRPVLKRVIEDQWRSFVHARLVGGDDVAGAASYLTKYATKSLDVPPRSSGGYGKIPSPKPARVLGSVISRSTGGERVDAQRERVPEGGKPSDGAVGATTSRCDPALEKEVPK